MKNMILKSILALGVIAFAVTLSECSCGKSPADNNSGNNSDSGNNGGGNGNNGGGNTIFDIKPLKFSDVNANLVKINNGTNILLKASAFPPNWAGIRGRLEDFDGLATTPDSTKTKAFDIEYDGATGGMIFVANGNIARADAIRTSGNVTTALNVTSGIHMTTLTTLPATGTLGIGLNIVSIFAENVPNLTSTQIAPDVAPFAFSATTGANASKPVLWCIATIPSITDFSAADVGTKALTGGQKSSCYVATTGQEGLGTAAIATAWFAASQPFKREIKVAVVGIKTDAKTIVNIGLPGGSDQANINTFADGFNGIDMGGLTVLNRPVAFTKFNIKIVNDTDFAAAP